MKRFLSTLGVVVLTAVVVAPVAATVAVNAASGRFVDVPDTNIFKADIEWLAGAGVTKGCNPPDNTRFCPEEVVNRQTMAAFINRFAGFLGAQDGVVSHADKAAAADKATTADNAATADNATNAGNADTLDGIDSSGFVNGQRLSASVTDGGTAGTFLNPTEVNDAVSVVKLATGSYEIFFDRNILGCIGTASPGVIPPLPGSGGSGGLIGPSVDFSAVLLLSGSDGGDLRVDAFSGGNPVSTSFMVNLICPAQELQP